MHEFHPNERERLYDEWERLSGEGHRKMASLMLGDLKEQIEEEEDYERRVRRIERALLLAVVDAIEPWLDCYPIRRGDPFEMSRDLRVRLFWIFGNAQALVDNRARTPRIRREWSFLRMLRRARDQFEIMGGKV